MIHTALTDHILRITLARPEKKNALTGAMYAALTDALTQAETDASVRVVLFDAEGDMFCAGNDLRDFAAVASGALAPTELKVHAFLDALAGATKPYVAAVQGAAVGIGTTLLLHCDLVYVAEDAKLSTPFSNLGLVPEAASSLLLPARIGHVRAFEMFALGHSIDGTAAASLGLANAALPANQVQTHALICAKALAAKPIGSLQATKKLMRDAQLIRMTIQREVEVFAERLKSAEAQEAFRAFVARKKEADSG
jgi:enoyl-CoA hydratase/carnithine racemase